MTATTTRTMHKIDLHKAHSTTRPTHQQCPSKIMSPRFTVATFMKIRRVMDGLLVRLRRSQHQERHRKPPLPSRYHRIVGKDIRGNITAAQKACWVLGKLMTLIGFVGTEVQHDRLVTYIHGQVQDQEPQRRAVVFQECGGRP